MLSVYTVHRCLHSLATYRTSYLCSNRKESPRPVWDVRLFVAQLTIVSIITLQLHKTSRSSNKQSAMTSLVQAWCSLPGMLERGIARLSDPPPAPRCWAEPPQVSGRQSVPEKAWAGTRGSGKQPQAERRRWRYGKTRPKTAGGRKPGDDLTKDVGQVKNIWKLLTWMWMTSYHEQQDDQCCSDTCQFDTLNLPNYINNNTAEMELYLEPEQTVKTFFLCCVSRVLSRILLSCQSF